MSRHEAPQTQLLPGGNFGQHLDYSAEAAQAEALALQNEVGKASLDAFDRAADVYIERQHQARRDEYSQKLHDREVAFGDAVPDAFELAAISSIPTAELTTADLLRGRELVSKGVEPEPETRGLDVSPIQLGIDMQKRDTVRAKVEAKLEKLQAEKDALEKTSTKRADRFARFGAEDTSEDTSATEAIDDRITKLQDALGKDAEREKTKHKIAEQKLERKALKNFRDAKPVYEPYVPEEDEALTNSEVDPYDFWGVTSSEASTGDEAAKAKPAADEKAKPASDKPERKIGALVGRAMDWLGVKGGNSLAPSPSDRSGEGPRPAPQPAARPASAEAASASSGGTKAAAEAKVVPKPKATTEPKAADEPKPSVKPEAVVDPRLTRVNELRAQVVKGLKDGTAPRGSALFVAATQEVMATYKDIDPVGYRALYEGYMEQVRKDLAAEDE